MLHKIKDKFWIALLIAVLLGLGIATLDTQPRLSADDMGKDLYAFGMFLEGEKPVRDFWWQYGPLMFFYYGFWLKIGGIHLISIRAGLALLYLFSAVLTYSALALFVSPPVAFLSGASFLIRWIVYPYYNFNHPGAMPLLLAGIFSLWKFFKTEKPRWIYIGSLSLAGMALVKINMGASSFAAFVGSLLFYWIFLRFRRENFSLPVKHLLGGIFLFLGVTLLGYVWMYGGSPWVYIEQGTTARKIYREQELSLRINLIHLVQWFWVWDRKRLWWLGLFSLLGLAGLLGIKKNPPEKGGRKIVLPVLVSLLLFEVLNLNDFFSFGQIYRVDYWSFPILSLGMGLAAYWARGLLPKKFRAFFWGILFLAVFSLPALSLRKAFASRVPGRFLPFERGRIYLVEENASSLEAIREGTRFILENTKPHEKILAVPCAPLYPFLSGRKHAVRELYFGKIAHLESWQEGHILKKLQTESVPIFILDNLDGQAPGIGKFGEDYSKEIAEFIFENYDEVKAFGQWEAANPRVSHAIKIFKKK